MTALAITLAGRLEAFIATWFRKASMTFFAPILSMGD
jgi:hypothetical protein